MHTRKLEQMKMINISMFFKYKVNIITLKSTKTDLLFNVYTNEKT